MRLIDRPSEVLLSDRRTGTGGRDAHAARELDAASASIRYVLDGDASNACADLVRSGDGLFSVENPLLRMPAEHFWVELFEESDGGGPDYRGRMGYLVSANDGGRSGTIVPYSETSEGLRRRLPCEIAFDLDGGIPRQPGTYALAHPHMTHLAELLSHCRLCPDHERIAARQPDSVAQTETLSMLAEGTWFALPLLFAFVALLNSPQVVETRHSDLHRLNRARARRGRAPLLDHIEVRLALGERAAGAGQGNALRLAPRLHVVRGHVVHRHGKTFWRQAHLRGDSQKAIVAKTVRVSAGRSVRRDAAHHVRKVVGTM